ncbi:MAG: peptidase M66 [Myxococcales bacterium]|nr:peptidase M66 [Myxococcales bacterium]
MRWSTVAWLALPSVLFSCDGAVGDLGEAEQVPEQPPLMLLAGNRPPVVSAFECDPAGGPAPLEASCSWAVSDPEGQPVSCALDTWGSPAPEIELGDCASASSTTARFEVAGGYLVRLLATDSEGERAVATFSLSVSEAPNRPPVITSLAATPARAVVPFEAELSWTISDPDGEALSCAVDVGADGSREYTLPSCTSATTQRHPFTAGGVVDVALVVTDARGLSASKAIAVTARTPVGDLRIEKVEWGQSVLSGDLKLVEGKPALLRVHVLGNKSGISGVSVRAQAFRAGALLGPVPLAGPSSAPTAVIASDLSQQWRGDVPEAWVAPGLEVRVLVDPEDALPETNEANNVSTLKPQVGIPTVLPLTSVPVVHQGVTAAVPSIDQTMRRVWPLKSVSNQTRAPYTFGGTLYATSTSSWGQLLQEMAALRQADGSKRYYYGFVRLSYTSGIAGMGYVGTPAAIGRDNSQLTAAHELGHNMGRNHAPCGSAGAPDPNYPYAGARLGSWGYDYVTQKIISPTASYDLMSYCGPEWVSDYNYEAVQEFLEGNPPVAVPGASPQVSAMVVSGRILPGGVELRPFQRVLAAPSPPKEGPYSLRLYTAERTYSVPFDVDSVADTDDGEVHFSFLVPEVGRLLAAEVLYGGRVLLRRSAQPVLGAPAVELVERQDEVVVRWDARLHPSAAVAHLGADGRTTLGLWLEGGNAVVRTDGLPPGGEWEVSLSDGLNPVRRTFAR